MHVNKNSTIFISYILYYKKKYETYGFATKADQADQPETESEPHKASRSRTKDQEARPNPWQAT